MGKHSYWASITHHAQQPCISKFDAQHQNNHHTNKAWEDTETDEETESKATVQKRTSARIEKSITANVKTIKPNDYDPLPSRESTRE